MGVLMRLFVGDDWAQDHHDIEVMGRGGKGAGPQAAAGGRWRDGAAACPGRRVLGGDADAGEVLVGIETDHGP
jgi:hypothetical protein